MNHYTNSFRRQKPKLFVFVNSASFTILSIINIVKILNGKQPLSYFDVVWILMPIVVCYGLVDFFSAKTYLAISDNILTIIESNLFHKKKHTYYIAEMEQIEVEQVKIKRIPFPGTLQTAEKVLTYFYHKKEIAIGFDLKNFNAKALEEAILTGK